MFMIRVRPVAFLVLTACLLAATYTLLCSSAAAEGPGGNRRMLSISSYGPVKVGMTPDQAATALGIPLTKDREVDDPNDCLYVANDEALPGVAFMVIGKKIVRFDVYQAGYHTDKGAFVGMPEEQLKKIYHNYSLSPHPYLDEDGHYVTVNDGGENCCLIFETDTKVVTSFRSGECQAVRAIEGCE